MEENLYMEKYQIFSIRSPSRDSQFTQKYMTSTAYYLTYFMVYCYCLINILSVLVDIV